MVKQRILSLLMAGILLTSTAIPAYAASEDDLGGLAPYQPASSAVSTDTSSDDRTAAPPPADDIGGLANPNHKTDSDTSGEQDTDSSEDPNPEEPTPEEPTPEEPETDEGRILAGVTLNTSQHIAYVSGSGGQFPTFCPTDGLTRAAAAVILYRLLPQDAELPATTDVSYSDVAANAWYAPAAQIMGALGVIRAGETDFQPNALLTRGEYVRYVASFFPLRTDAELFSDVSESDENAPFIRSARAYGWVQGGTDGTFKPNDTLTRAAAVSILNHALGRKADTKYIAAHHPAFFLDVPPDSWCYYEILEASVAHQHSGEETWTSHTARTLVPTNGFHILNGWTYYYDTSKGDIARNRSIGNLPFNALGHFTSGNDELDGKLRDIVMKNTNSSMTKEQQLRALYVYTRDSFKYLRRPAYSFGATGFMVTDALRILNTGYGNCYCYASLFWFLSRWIGYDSVIYSGTVGQNRAPHSWVEIKFDEKWYIFDTELEMAYHKKGRYDVNLYKYSRNNGWNYIRPKS